MTYAEKLKDPRWQKKRLEILSRDNFTCQHCGDNENTLHVHHKYYILDLDPWEYKENAFITLCEFCHELEYEISSTREKNFINLLYDLGLYPIELNGMINISHFPLNEEMTREEIIDNIISNINNLKNR